MKSTLQLRPVYHRLEDRIRAHIVLCWLALLLIRVAETATGDTWRKIRHQLDQLHLGTFTSPAGTITRRTATLDAVTTSWREAGFVLPEPTSRSRRADQTFEEYRAETYRWVDRCRVELARCLAQSEEVSPNAEPKESS